MSTISDYDNPPPPYSVQADPGLSAGGQGSYYAPRQGYYYDTNYSSSSVDPDERTPLVYSLRSRTIVINPHKNHSMVSRVWMWVCLTLAVTCIVAVATLFTQNSHANKLQARVDELTHHLQDYPPTRAELEQLKHDWAVAKAAYEEESKTWDDARAEFEEESKTWDDARAEFEADKERWAQARNHHYTMRVHEGNLLGLAWNSVQSHQCVAYGTRAYSAHLAVDKHAACQYMPLPLGGEFVDEPHECYSEYDDYRGVWRIGNDLGCQPHWGKLYDKGCVGWGVHRYEARLWDIHGDWMDLCTSTPHDINGQHFAKPTHCQNRGIFFGMVGMWDVDDLTCL